MHAASGRVGPSPPAALCGERSVAAAASLGREPTTEGALAELRRSMTSQLP